jgi:hypothetical protein
MKFSLTNKYVGVYKLDIGFWRFYFCALFTFGSKNSVVKNNLFRIQTSFEFTRKAVPAWKL